MDLDEDNIPEINHYAFMAQLQRDQT